MVPTISSHSILHREFLARPISTLFPKPAICVSPDVKIKEAIARLCAERVGCLLVTNNGKLEGILTERDLLLKVHSNGGVVPAISVHDIMSPHPTTVRQSAGISRLLHDMAVGGYRHMPVILGNSGAFGVLSTTDFVDSLHKRLTKKILNDDTTLEFDRNVVDEFFGSNLSILEPDAPLALPSKASVNECVAMMVSARKGALAVISDTHRVIGIFTERDYLRKVLLRALDPSCLPVKDYMSHPVQTLMPSATVAFAFQCMSEQGYRHLPIVNSEERLTGIISVRTVINYLATGILEAVQE